MGLKVDIGVQYIYIYGFNKIFMGLRAEIGVQNTVQGLNGTFRVFAWDFNGLRLL